MITSYYTIRSQMYGIRVMRPLHPAFNLTNDALYMFEERKDSSTLYGAAESISVLFIKPTLFRISNRNV